MVVQHNLTAMNANRYFGINNSKLSKSLEKLSSGYAINRAGDNAAGLAVSEKMRSQIAGMTQGVKNAQDGISMIQTFEGALTETDSILQRMKTLADQAAHGTYQDEVDREAIQLEFDQLNDELNQIADTDFNGVILLNGGQMADGLQAVDGKFDYANKEAQVMAKANELAQKQFEDATKAYNEAFKNYKANKYDLSENGTAPEWNTVDDSKWTKATADAFWKAMKWDDVGDGSGNVDLSKASSVDITLEFDGTTWAIKDGKTNTGTTLTKDQLTAGNVTVAAASDGAAATVAGKGGVDVTIGGVVVKAIYDASEAKKGDTITLTFTNTEPGTKAPNHIGFRDDTYEKDGDATDPTLSLATGLTDDKITDDIAKHLNALNDMEFSWNFDGTTDKKLEVGGVDLSDVDATGKVVEFEDKDGNKFNLFVKNAGGAVTFSEVDATGAAAGQELFTLNVGAAVASKVGSSSGALAVSVAAYNEADAEPNVKAGDNPDLESSKPYKDAYNAAKKALAEATAAQLGIKDYESAKAYLDEEGVSVSDAFDNSTTKLTYTDHLIMQVGARSKDAVDFTFSYASEGLGDLKANMNCSAREDGLGTANLSLLTAKSANAAIDKIDNAINKVSMVRATFGATQNRLEHKIDNMNVTIENLTSAESRIRDTNMAEEMMNFTKQQILSQASQSMLAQANQLPQSVLQLLQ